MTSYGNKNRNQITGKKGEEIAANYLKEMGYVIVASNYKRKYGEIDLIVQYGAVVAFVEVKMRNNAAIPLESIILPIKQKKIIKTAKLFVSERNITDMILRFDVILINNNNGDLQCDHIQSAFLCDE